MNNPFEIDLNSFKSKITNTKVKKVVNVYQQEYINGKAEGFGDYLRGCISLSLLCSKLGLEFGMNIKNHIIKHFMNVSFHIDNSIDYNSIKKISIAGKYSDKNDIECILSEINNTNYEICYLYTTLFFNDTVLYNNSNKLYINPIIRSIIPNNTMIDILNKLIIQLGLNLNNQSYNIIHIRCGDNLLLNNNSDKTTIDSFISFIIKKIQKNMILPMNRSNKYVIIGDNIYCKQAINTRLSNTIMINNIEPVHLGLGNTNLNNVMGTMLDFYLMARAYQIISFSRYSHGSGFSKWASFLFNRNYIQYSFNDVIRNFTSFNI